MPMQKRALVALCDYLGTYEYEDPRITRSAKRTSRAITYLSERKQVRLPDSSPTLMLPLGDDRMEQAPDGVHPLDRFGAH